MTLFPSLGRSPVGPVGLLAIAAALSGCASEFQGKWKGACNVGVGSNGAEVPINFEIVDTGKGTVGGTGAFGFNDFTFEGSADGRVVDDEALKVEIEGVYGGYVIQLELETTLETEGELEGICAFKDQETLYEGDVTLTSVGE